ncbi:unnamed protein product [Phaedon cochleariae]|uniref:Uncharacterized protein n=1 Tax=Phaedon cochleariae TaxID=80249 RepID=A0A9N9X262_PHACE|nr:unnamed protein product [Phaedon cochleariae]
MGRDGTRSQSQSSKGEDELHSVVKDFVTKLYTADDFIRQLTETITGIIEQKYNPMIEELKNENRKINDKLQKQEDMINILMNHQKKHEQIRRSRNLRIYGVEEKVNENITKSVLDIFTTKMKLKLDESSIEFCYRLKKKELNKTSPIMLRFSSNYFKNMVYNNKKLLKSTKIVIREDLTTEQLKIVSEAMKKVGASGVVWTNSGKIYVKLNSQQNGIRIGSLDDINKLRI